MAARGRRRRRRRATRRGPGRTGCRERRVEPRHPRVQEGPVSLAEDLASRLHISVASLGASATQATVFAVSIASMIVLAIRWPRFPAGDALLTGIAVSLVVNDSPGAIASAGALSYAVLFAYERVCGPARDHRRVGNVGAHVPGFASRT